MKTFALVIAASLATAMASSEPVMAREGGTRLRRLEGMPSPPQPQQMPNEAAQDQQRNPNGNREHFGWGPGLYGGGLYGGGLYGYPYGGFYGGGYYY